jgi:hypothetical protein
MRPSLNRAQLQEEEQNIEEKNMILSAKETV